MPEFDILVAGELNPDLILSKPDLELHFGQEEIVIDELDLSIGSSSAIFACGAARLGLKVAFIGVVGNDLFGDFILKALTRREVDTSHVIVDPGTTTGISVILNRKEDRAILTYLGAMSTLKAEQITDDLLRTTRHLHVASYFLQWALQPGLPNLLRRAHSLGLTLSLDTNWDPTGQWEKVIELLPHIDVFLPNENEALRLTSSQTVEEALAKLAKIVPTTAIKQGARGATARHGDRRASAVALPIAVADTVGAGDSFDAGFIYGFLQGWSLEESLELAVACGSLSTRAHGGTPAQPSLDEALKSLHPEAK